MKKILILLFLVGLAVFIFFPRKPQINLQLLAKYESLVNFSQDFEPAEKELILQIIDESLIPDLEFLDQIYFNKLYEENHGAQTSFEGTIFLNQNLFNDNLKNLKRSVAHEIGHLFDFYTFPDKERLAYANLRSFSQDYDLAKNWFQNYDPHDLGKINIEKWKQEPAEDLAEAFSRIYFDIEEESIILRDRPLTSEVKIFFDDHFIEIEKYREKALSQNLSINAQIMFEELSVNAINPAKLFQLPGGYGNLIYLFPKKNANQEYVFVSYKSGDPNKQIHYYYSPIGYDNYESYFQKAADEIVYYDRVNYYILENQGANKDYILVSNGEMVLMANGESITKYDLMLMMIGAGEFEKH